MAGSFFPLFHKNNDKKSCHGKIDAFRIKRDQIAGCAADHAAGDPVTVIEERDKKEIPFAADALRRGCGTEDRICLIGQRKNHIRFQFSGILKFVEHGQTVKQVAYVDGEGDEEYIQKMKRNRQQFYGHELHGTGIDRDTHQDCPAGVKALAAEKDAEGDAQKQISHQNGQRDRKSGPKSFFDHGRIRLLCMILNF